MKVLSRLPDLKSENSLPISHSKALEEKLKQDWIKEQDVLQKRHILSSSQLTFSINKDMNSPPELQFPGLKLIAGVDLSFFKDDPSDAIATLVILSYPELKVVHVESETVKLNYPYISGFLAFREVSPLAQLIQKVKEEKPELVPQVIFVDGNGVLHPRKFGLACHLGVVANIPTIGIAKSLLHLEDGPHLSHAYSALSDSLSFPPGSCISLLGISGFEYGVAFRKPPNSGRPVYISAGHCLSLPDAVRLVASCCRYRIPEPIRQADLRSRALVRGISFHHSI